MGIVVVPSFGADPVTITGPTLDAKVDGLATEFNGNIDEDNLSATASIPYANLNLTGLVKGADLAIPVTTAGAISGAALITLGNTPSGAGILPIANLPSTTLLRKALVLKVTADADLLVAGDGAMYFTCPAELNGMNLVAVGASTLVAGTGVTIQIARGRRSAANGALTFADMLSTRITIDTGEYDSINGATPAVIDTSNDDIVVSTYVDVLRVDVDVASGAGLEVRLSFQTP
jgi:hypothetical protein